MSMNQERLMKIIVGAHTSEKTHRVGEKHNQFVFKVVRDARKEEIAQAVEDFFKVKVLAVNVVNIKQKRRYFRQIAGKLKAWKKAYVTLAEGCDIQFSDLKA